MWRSDSKLAQFWWWKDRPAVVSRPHSAFSARRRTSKWCSGASPTPCWNRSTTITICSTQTMRRTGETIRTSPSWRCSPTFYSSRLAMSAIKSSPGSPRSEPIRSCFWKTYPFLLSETSKPFSSFFPSLRPILKHRLSLVCPIVPIAPMSSILLKYSGQSSAKRLVSLENIENFDLLEMIK